MSSTSVVRVPRRRNRRRQRVVVVQNSSPPQPRANGRARRRRARRARIREELRRCRDGGVTADLGSAPPGIAGIGMSPEMPGLPITTGMTPSGEQWALKAIHPNGEEATGVQGIPDHVSVPVVTPEFRTNFVISPIGTSASATDDVDIMVLPFADMPMMYRRYASGTSIQKNSSWKPVWNATVNTTTSLITVPSAISTTASTVTFAKTTSDMDKVYGYGRVTHKGVTCHLDAPALSDQGRVIAGQVALPFAAEQSRVAVDGWSGSPPTGGPSTPVVIIDSYNLDSVPLEENCLVQSSPGAASWEARQGVYVPMRFRDPVHLFKPSGDAVALALTLSGGTYEAIESTNTISGPSGTTGVVPAIPSPRMLLNCQTAIVLFRGISPTANIHSKVITGLEALVETCSAVSPYQRISPALDVEAINTVTRLGQELPQAFPASYNDFGFLGNIIKPINNILKPFRNKVLRKMPLVGKYFDWQEENIYQPLGLAGPTPMSMPTMTGWHDPLRRVYDRMANRRSGYGGLYA